ncbi:MAG: type II toxin-antitoxin system RelE/ParE family toxin [Xanthomonadales bacterium]|nr:type II toxin-antitoxin system RelE/ParE family toxin [Xanthomonadales bacterium]MBK7144690.1 type II toxin-antitoxin system RelE/ParE family toxin [Xanthomonadales bacterium]MCC6562706.1 type II toxin-antitoxin system RelE/ParE family toxin [Xanthomonadales bacterium]
MAWRVEFHPKARKELQKLDPVVAKRILVFLHGRVAVAENPRSLGQALHGSNLGEFWKYRVGDFRIVCCIEDAMLRVLVVRVGNRGDVYR